MTQFNTARREQARGNGVAQAGQFGHQAHTEPGAFDNAWWGQEAEPEEAVVAASIDVSVRRFGLPSNRHRKEQSYVTPGVLAAETRVVDADDAPRAVTLTPHAEDRPGGALTLIVNDGVLYSSTGMNLEQTLRSHYGVGDRWADDHDAVPVVDEDRMAKLQEEAANDWIVVDGTVHIPAEEPLLHATPWGVKIAGRHRVVDERGFLTDPDAYTLAEWKQAKASAELQRRTYEDGSSDEDHSATLDLGEGFASVRSAYRRPPKLDYEAWPHYTRWEDRHDVNARELAKMRSGIARVPEAVSRVDDGLGGTRAVIDWALFSENQERDYKCLLENSGEQ